jgi:O-succinylbenzoate synthase
MHYQFKFRPYRRQFARTLTTNHGSWNIREGIILSLTSETGRVGWGEIAPISWFGSETLEQALDFCRQLPEEITDEMIFSIPDDLPACQFGFESAVWEGSFIEPLRRRGSREFDAGEEEAMKASCLVLPVSPIAHSALLPTGGKALQEWERLWQQGYRTFKWKIGVYSVVEELKVFELLTHALPASTKLRLDANGGLNYESAQRWLGICDKVNGTDKLPVEIEFIEQPLSVQELEAMLELANCYETAIALDESVATLNQLARCFQQGWQEIFVIKPGIVGSPSRLRQFCQQHEIDAVFSSVFETAIGRQAALQLAAELSTRDRANGFGIHHWFTDDEETWLKNLW